MTFRGAEIKMNSNDNTRAMKPGTIRRDKYFFERSENSFMFVLLLLLYSLKRLTGKGFTRCSYAHSCRSFSLDCCKVVAPLLRDPLKRLTGNGFTTTVSESN